VLENSIPAQLTPRSLAGAPEASMSWLPETLRAAGSARTQAAASMSEVAAQQTLQFSFMAKIDLYFASTSLSNT
jgi:hypothetical protein